MRIQVVSRSGKELIKGGLHLPDTATVDDLKQEIYRKSRKYYPERQRLTLESAPGQASPPLAGTKNLRDIFPEGSDHRVALKDLGPQVRYSTLFFWEYFGPLLIYPAFYFLPLYRLSGYPPTPTRTPHHPIQTFALAYWSLHYLKRILETFFVHRFSHATSPFHNVPRNCAYYWTFAVLIAYSLNHPHYTPPPAWQSHAGFALGLAFQLANLRCHLLLRGLRPPTGGGYCIPRGFLFDHVTCANYTTEIWQWLCFNIATQTLAGYLFLLAATLIMTNWALAKHRRLKRIFDGRDGREKYPSRWVILPPFL